MSENSHLDQKRTSGFFASERAAQISLRIGYIGSSAYLFWAGLIGINSGELIANPQLLVIIFGIYGLAFGLMYFGAASLTRERLEKWQPLIFASFLLGSLFQYFMRFYEFQATHRPTDAFLFSDYASQLLMLGENPYSWDMAGAYSAFRVSTLFSTPLLNGELVSGLNYPALHFLTFLPSAALGILDSRFVLVMASIGTIFLFYRNAPPPLKGVVLLPFFVNLDFANWPLGFVTDSVWVFLLVGMIASWRRPKLRAVLFGLAAAFKQLPWLLAPFIVLRLWLDKNDSDPRPPLHRVARFIGISAGVFAIINAPFLMADSSSWLSGVFTPLVDPLIFYGQGLSTVTQFGLLQLPKSFYSLATAVMFVSLGVLYWLNFRLLKDLMWVFPGMFLWFSYRGLQSYYIYWLLLLLMALLIKYRQSASSIDEALPSPRLHRYSWIVVGIASASLVGGLIYFRTTMTPISVELTGAPTGISPHQIDHLSIQVDNTSNQEIRPRFAVHSLRHQAYPWLIESGPPSLAPGQEGNYEISTDLPYRMINLVNGALVSVTDASGDYRVQGTLQLQRDSSLLGPDAIFNSAYLRGPQQDAIPWGWGFEIHDAEPLPVLDYQTSEGFRAVELGFVPTLGSETWEYLGISQWIPFPTGELSTWVHPPPLKPTSRIEPTNAYGLEFDDGSHKLWILFGSESAAGYLADNHYYIFKPAPLDEWSQQKIDLRAIYNELDWELPPIQRVVRGDLELLSRMGTVKLIVAARDQQEASVVAGKFGPLEIVQDRNSISERVADNVSYEAEYSTAIGDQKRRQRNYSDAALDYRLALAADPRLGPAYFGLGESLFWQGDYAGAADAYQHALEDPAVQAEAHKGLAWANFNLGKYDLAEIAFQDSIRLGIHPPIDLADSYNGLGWVYLRRGECDEAIPYFEQSLEINPEPLDAQRGIETCRGLIQSD